MGVQGRFVIIDAMALAYKAYFAFISRPLRTKEGEPTSAVFGFVMQLIKILEDIQPTHIAVAFDSKEKTFRHERYAAYKATRQEMPEDLVPQIGRLKEVIEALDIPLYILPGYEADDIIGTAVKAAAAQGFECFMITPDKDYVQLVGPNIKLARPGKSSDDFDILDEERVRAQYGFNPEQMIDYLALVGDSSDNIPGVKGVGEKSALPLIQAYGSIEAIYEHLDAIKPPGVQAKLKASHANALLSKELATIHLSVPFTLEMERSRFTTPDLEKVNKLFTQLEFKNPYVRLRKLFEQATPEADAPAAGTVPEASNAGSDATAAFSKDGVKYHLITTLKDAKALARKLGQQPLFVFDTETDGLDRFTLHIAGASFCYTKGEAYFVAIDPFIEGEGLFTPDLSGRLPVKDFIAVFKPVFENSSIKKVCQNAKFDIAVLRRYGIATAGFFFDTMVASYLIDPDQKHGMDDLSEKYLQYKPIPLSELIGAKKDASLIWNADLQRLSDYACEDADITYQLYTVLAPLLTRDGLEQLAYRVEFPLIPVLEIMEQHGITVDRAMLQTLSKELEKWMEEYAERTYRLAGERFNLNSPTQLQKILYEKLGLTAGKKTKTGYSTDAQTLEGLRGEHDIINDILLFRGVSKLKSTYADALPALIHPATGRVHTSFNQTVASTGRLSSLDPNLQNIPIRTDMGKEIRKAFVPEDKDHIILSADYSQIELRIMASMSGDPALIRAFANGEDIHRSTAALVFGVSPDAVTPDMRRKAKEVNFGILYGIGIFGLKTRLGIDQKSAKEIIETYFRTFGNVKAFMDQCIAKAKENGYAETLLGRRRYLRNIKSSNFAVRQFEERVAINMPIQGTAAEMIKLAMIAIQAELERRRMRSKMVLQVHDELLFDTHRDELEELRPLVKRLMEEALPLNVPVVADTGVGDNWLDAH